MTPEPSVAAPAGKSGIGGWLLLPALALALQPVFFVWAYLDAYRMARHATRIRVDVRVLVVDLVVLLGAAFVARLFFTRKRVAPAWYVLYVAFMVALWNLTDAFADQLHAPLVPLLFLSLVLVPYLTLSRRVAATFVADLDPGHWLERPLAATAPRLEAFQASLRRLRWWIVPLALAFVVLVTVLYAFLRATFVLGDLGEMGQLLFG